MVDLGSPNISTRDFSSSNIHMLASALYPLHMFVCSFTPDRQRKSLTSEVDSAALQAGQSAPSTAEHRRMLERLQNQANSMRERLEDVSRDRAALRQEVVIVLPILLAIELELS